MRGLFEETFKSKTNSVKIGIRNDCMMENFTSSFGEVFFLIDGMNEIKEVASTFKRVASSIKKHIILNPNQTLNPNQIIEESIKSANSLREYVIEKKSVQNETGSIFLLIKSKAGTLYYNYYGDSVLYLIRGNSICNLEKIRPSEKGIEYGLDPSYDENEGLITYKDDKLLLCSYRMTEVLDNQIIFNIVNDLQPKQACEELLDLSSIFECKDYVSVQIFHILKNNLLSDDTSDVKSDGKFEKKKINKKGSAIIRSIEDINKTNFQEDIQGCFDERKRRKFSLKYLSIGGIMISVILISAVLEFEVFNNNKTINGSTQTSKINKVFTQAPNDLETEEQFRKILKEKPIKENDLTDFGLIRLDTNILIDNIIYKDLSSNTLSDNDIKKLIKDLRDSNLIFKEYEKIRDYGQDQYNIDFIIKENGNVKTLTLLKEGNKYKISKILLKQGLNKLKPLDKISNTKVNRSYKNNESYSINDEELYNNKYKEEKRKLNYSKRIILDDRVLK